MGETDTISRQAALDTIMGQPPESHYPSWYAAQIEELPAVHPATNCSEIPNSSDDTISRQAAIDALDEQIEQCNKALCSFDISPKDEYAIKVERASLEAYKEQLENMPSAQPEKQHGRIFQEIVVRYYPSYNPYPERQGKPYFSIKYTENGQEFIGYSTYKPEVLSEYLKEYFMTSAQPEPSEITDERAILHLQSTGWMQNHNREIYESGLKERLADDSESYDSLIPHEDDGDTISRQMAIDAIIDEFKRSPTPAIRAKLRLEALPSVAPSTAHTTETTAETTAPSTDDWIPVERELPEDLAEVNVTWVNHKPEPYYDFVKDKPCTGSAVYYKGDWYWYSSVCADVLAEYGRNDVDKVDDAIEITAWKPLPEPYQGGDSD